MTDTDRSDILELKFRLMGFGIGLALLVTLTPTWLTWQPYSRLSDLELYSGISLLGLTPGADSPMQGLGTVLFLAYVLLALGLLIAAHPGATLLMGLAGLVVSLVVVLHRPEAHFVTIGWTGAPAVALGLWALAVVVSGIALKKTRS